MQHHVRVLFPALLWRPRKIATPHGASRCPDHFAEVPADFCGIRINRADNFNGLFFPHQSRDGCADRADTILDWREFFFSRRSPFSVQMRAMRIFSSKGNPTIMEFPGAFNEEPRLGVRRLAVALRAETRFGEEKAGAFRVRSGREARALQSVQAAEERRDGCRLRSCAA